jgi:hypothetical protein
MSKNAFKKGHPLGLDPKYFLEKSMSKKKKLPFNYFLEKSMSKNTLLGK